MPPTIDVNVPIPKVETIRQAMLAVLQDTQSVSQDGHLTDLTVEEVDAFYNGSGDLLATIEAGVDAWVDQGDVGATTGRDTYDQEFLVLVRIQQDDGGIAFDTRGLQAVAAVRKAISAAAATGALRGLILWLVPRGIMFRGMTLFTVDGETAAGVRIPFTVRYRTSLDDPFNG